MEWLNRVLLRRTMFNARVRSNCSARQRTMPRSRVEEAAQLKVEIDARLENEVFARQQGVGKLRYASNLCSIIAENPRKYWLAVKCLPVARAAFNEA
jgi:hypothetical protein